VIEKIVPISNLGHNLEVEMSILLTLIKWVPEILVAYLAIKFIKVIAEAYRAILKK